MTIRTVPEERAAPAPVQTLWQRVHDGAIGEEHVDAHGRERRPPPTTDELELAALIRRYEAALASIEEWEATTPNNVADVAQEHARGHPDHPDHTDRSDAPSRLTVSDDAWAELVERVCWIEHDILSLRRALQAAGVPLLPPDPYVER